MSNNSARLSRGFSLLEVLVALVVLTTGILGAVAMQLAAKRGSYGALERTQAVALANDLIERARSNPDSAALYAGTFGYGQTGVAVTSCTRASNCNSANMAARDKYEWSQLLLGANTREGANNLAPLDNAVGCVAVNTNAITVTVSWESIESSSDSAVDANCGTASARRRQTQVSSVVW